MGHRAADGSRRGGGRRGEGHRKHGLQRWATIWMEDNFGYYQALQDIKEIRGGGDSDSIEEAIGEAEDIVSEWEDIAGRMGGTTFLDACESLAWKVIEQGYAKIDNLEIKLEMAIAMEAMSGDVGGLIEGIFDFFF